MTAFGDQWLALTLATLAIFAIAFAAMDEASVVRRVYRDFVFLIAAPLIALISWALFALSRATELPLPLWQALIAGLVIASGWLTTAIFAELARARGKAERMRDYHKAIYAEIRTTLSSLFNDGEAQTYAASIIEKMQAEPDFVPFIPLEKHDFIYTSISSHIDVLPRQTIDAIVAYYSQVASIAALADDMRSAGFQALSHQRRIAMYSDYTKMREVAFNFGTHALRLIAAYSDGGASAAQSIINTQGAALSAPSPEWE